MKVIDLLNKIANGEEVPKQIIYCGVDYYWTNSTYENPEAEEILFWFDVYSEEHLNNEIEIIEEDRKDEEIEIYINGEKVDITDIYEPLKQGEYFYKENGKWYVHKLKNVSKTIEEDKKIEKLTPFEAPFLKDEKPDIRFRLILDKINEIINHLNKEREQ